jgi:hypothetical protein
LDPKLGFVFRYPLPVNAGASIASAGPLIGFGVTVPWTETFAKELRSQ